VPTSTSEPTSCRFAPRCPHAFEDCEAVHPERIDVGDGNVDHEAACLLYDDRFEESAPEEKFANDGGERA
jgi:peptide/nickel transport system ATP-binding protein